MDEYANLTPLQKAMLGSRASHDDTKIVVDSDSHFIIDTATRKITNTSGKRELVQFDHDSERLTFEIDRLIDGHDVLTCDVIRINYLNGDKEGVYDVMDAATKTDDESKVTFTWLISGNATKTAGTINFAITFRCVNSEGKITYSWNTAIDSSLVVVNGLDNDDVVNELDVDILEQWKQSLFGAGDSAIAKIEAAEAEAVESVKNAVPGQVQDIVDEGAKQLKLVQDAAAGVVDDREQIQKNKNAIDNKLDKKLDASYSGQFLSVDDYGNIVPSKINSNESVEVWREVNVDWESGMLGTNGDLYASADGFYTKINVVIDDEYMVSGKSENSSFYTLMMDKGYNTPIWTYLKRVDGGDLTEISGTNATIENAVVKCIKSGIMCINTKSKSTIKKLTTVTLEDALSAIPTKTSELVNDSNFVDESKLEDALSAIPTKTSERIDIGDVLYGIVGKQCQLYKRSFIEAFPAQNAFFCTKMDNALDYPRYLEITTMADGDTSVDFNIVANDGNIVDTKKITFIACTPTNPSQKKNILFIGDSRTYSGDMVLEVSRLLSNTTGVASSPSSFNLTNYNVVGRRKKYDINSTVGFEGNSGWSPRTYVEGGVKSFVANVDGSMAGLKIGATYTYTASNGKTATVMVEEIDDSTITFSYASWSNTTDVPNTLSGNLTKASGDGAESISFSSYTVGKWSPFRINDEITFTPYVNKYCDGKLDCVCIWLGINDLLPLSEYDASYFDTYITNNIVKYLRNMISKLHVQFPAVKVLLSSEIIPSQNGGLALTSAVKYAATSGGLTRLVRRVNAQYKALADELDYVYYLDNNSQFDSEYGYETRQKQVNLRDPQKETLDANNVHPTQYGYWQHADSFVRAIVNIIK